MSADTGGEAIQWWSRRDKRTAKRAGHYWLSQPLYKGEAYDSRCSFGAFRPDNVLYDGTTPFEYVEVVRGRKAAPKWDRRDAHRARAQDEGEVMDDKDMIEWLKEVAEYNPAASTSYGYDVCARAAARLTALAEENERLRGALETAKDDMLDMLGYVTLEGNGFSTVQERDEWFASDLAKIDTALAPAARKEAT